MKLALAHLFGDYVVQNDHMARHKVKTAESPDGALSAFMHALTYTACHLPVTRNPKALIVIGGTHYVIDRYRLAKKVVWARNQLAPSDSRYPYAEAGPFGQKMTKTVRVVSPEFPGSMKFSTEMDMVPDGPDWLHGWLLFICDNSMHLLINYLAVKRWP